MIDMDRPMGRTPLDRPGGLVGQGLDRIDGKLKVTGRAPYAYEYRFDRPAYGFLVLSTIARGRIQDIDTASVEQAAGVILILTHRNMPKQAPNSPRTAPQLVDDRIAFRGQPIALVVADSFENARAASYLVKVRYVAEMGAHDLAAAQGSAIIPPPRNGSSPDTSKGDVDAALAAAPVKIEATYRTPAQTHAMMEPHATIAVWNGERLVLCNANQNVSRGAATVAATLQIPRENVRVISRYVGGGFGAKLAVQADAILAAVAARMIRRPIKLALTRPQVFPATTHRSDTIQRLRLAADRDGTLLAVAHESWSDNAPGENSYEGAAQATRNIYATPNLLTAHRLVHLDLPVSAAMRAPGEAVGLLALECAMDELAVALEIDPIELRIRNEPRVDPQRGTPFSTRMLVPCMRKGAELFGWSRRSTRTGQVRDGEWLVGMGMAAAIRGNPMLPAAAKVALGPDGMLVVSSSMTDIGTGSYTILAQIAADLLGLPIHRVAMRLGDSDLPPTPGSGGSFGANSAGSAVYDACMNLRGKLIAKAGFDAGTRFIAGRLESGGRSATIEEVVGSATISADGAADPGQSRKTFTQESFGAHFAEVGVNEVTGEIRLRRMLGVFAAGRILNGKTARSQAIGGMVFGVGAALMEAIVTDVRDGSFVNDNLAEYHVAVHADIPAIDAVFLPELDPHSSAMKSKGIGELGICGAGASVANAVYNATGIRIRDYPLTLDKILDAWSRETMPEQRSEVGSVGRT
ncbi:MAG TPA: xanthine dehydrogenase family protein molybdopterin-binding subunit [Acetobacteraceae bacterium]|nr:xanthine dehydrogenase family protein molybdopterin-binding subunit [Acetobacteraceae bacterium]